MKIFYISTRDFEALTGWLPRWVNKKYPEIKTEIEKDGPQTILMEDETGDVIEEDFWVEFCND